MDVSSSLPPLPPSSSSSSSSLLLSSSSFSLNSVYHDYLISLYFLVPHQVWAKVNMCATCFFFFYCPRTIIHTNWFTDGFSFKCIKLVFVFCKRRLVLCMYSNPLYQVYFVVGWVWSSRWNYSWIHVGLLLLTVTDVPTTCAVVIFWVKVSCITSLDGIILWLLTWLVNYVMMLLAVCQLSCDVIGMKTCQTTFEMTPGFKPFTVILSSLWK